tara:strand:- start:877 stop:1026 length:150 start_codon:yes stop_codon:yes gene_type:complete
LVGHDDGPAIGSDEKLKPEHFALTVTGRANFEAKLHDKAIPHQRFVLTK